LSSVGDEPGPDRGSSPLANGPLLPKGLKQPRRSSPRLQSFDYTGPYAYSITINTDGSRPNFDNVRFLGFCVEALHERAALNAFEVLAYCFMPNHVHLRVAGLTETSRLKPFIQQFKQITGYAFKQEHGVSLWHRSYYDHVLRKEEDIHAVAAYIWGNPVRAGLVQSAEEYPHSGLSERLLDEERRSRWDAALGGQSLSSVRTDTHPPSLQA